MRRTRTHTYVLLICFGLLLLASLACGAGPNATGGGLIRRPEWAALEVDGSLEPESPTATPIPPTETPVEPPPAETEERSDEPPQPDAPTATPLYVPSPTPEVEPALLDYFSAFPEQTRLAPGETYTVFWGVQHAETVSICAYDHAGWEKWCLDDIAPEGKQDFEMLPDVAWLELRLYAVGFPDPGYFTTYAYAICANTWFMGNPPFACPNSALNYLSAIAQPFERGWLIYTPDVNDADIFFFGGAYFNPFLPYGFAAYADVSDLTAPTGLASPDPALAAIWLGQAPGTEDLRDRLGWATGPAIAIQTTEQCEFDPSRTTTQPCYQPGPNGIYQFTYEPFAMGGGYGRVGRWQTYTGD